jgi:hypothetical protein
MRVKKTLVAAALAGLTTMLLAGPAAADVIKVSPGGSIQAAIDKAGEGDTVKLAAGTYQESVQIKTDGITLKGAGADETVIQPGTSTVDPFCEGSGICVADVELSDPNAPPTVRNVIEDVRVKDLKVTGFAFTGVLFFGTRDQRVNDVLAEGNEGYGIAAFNTTGGQYWDNVTPNNHEAGIYVGDSPHANALVRDNVSYGNLGNGIFIRDASHGVVEDNQTSDNCIGILFLETPEPTENSDWVARDNSANHNNAACPAGEEGDATSGIGIVIFGAHGITLADNTANGNQPGGDTPASAGIIVVSAPGATPAETFLATDNVIKHNTAFGNLPVDLLWDGQGDNTFTANRCKTSNPDGLCAKGTHGHGDGHHGDHGDHGDKGHHGGKGHHGDKGHHGKHKHGKHKGKKPHKD